ncbi:MAG: LLM class F420-dependent oxidoreductase [Acidimicrobiia bacterium]|nr:LLM class F420-dependent oxidoreductase [Acidimicrobiia bacterium]
MQFGAFIPQGWRVDLVDVAVEDHWSTMLGVARHAEALGFDSAWVYDHFHTVPEPTQEVTYEAWTLMSALAVTTDSIRLGQMCTCNGYRPPAYLAKVAASIDVLSRGRLEMGIGGGWYEHEFDAYGYEFPKPAIRLGQLDEAVQVMRAMWTEDEASFDGRYYSLDSAICQPKPLQEPTIPIWVAGGGEQLTLRTAARYADATNFGSDPASFAHKRSVLHRHCERIGRDPSTITNSASLNVLIGVNDAAVATIRDRLRDRYARVVSDADRTIDRWFGAVQAAVGTPERIVEIVEAYRDEGCDYLILNFPEAATDPDAMALFATEVMPSFR